MKIGCLKFVTLQVFLVKTIAEPNVKTALSVKLKRCLATPANSHVGGDEKSVLP